MSWLRYGMLGLCGSLIGDVPVASLRGEEINICWREGARDTFTASGPVIVMGQPGAAGNANVTVNAQSAADASSGFGARLSSEANPAISVDQKVEVVSVMLSQLQATMAQYSKQAMEWAQKIRTDTTVYAQSLRDEVVQGVQLHGKKIIAGIAVLSLLGARLVLWRMARAIEHADAWAGWGGSLEVLAGMDQAVLIEALVALQRERYGKAGIMMVEGEVVYAILCALEEERQRIMRYCAWYERCYFSCVRRILGLREDIYLKKTEFLSRLALLRGRLRNSLRCSSLRS